MADQSRTTAFAVPVTGLPYAVETPHGGDDDVTFSEPHERRKGKMVNTNHLQLLQGEVKRFGATHTKRLWIIYQKEDTIVVTDQRVLFLWRMWMFGMSLVSREESFYLDDLQFVCLLRLIRWVWLFLSLILITLAAILLAVGNSFKPTTSTYSYYGTVETGNQGAYDAYVACGVIILLAGVAFFVVFVFKHLGRGVYVSLNFCRKNTGIVDWNTWSYWRPRHSSIRCMIKLQRERAQAAYNLLNGIVHEKFSLKVAHEV